MHRHFTKEFNVRNHTEKLDNKITLFLYCAHFYRNTVILFFWQLNKRYCTVVIFFVQHSLFDQSK